MMTIITMRFNVDTYLWSLTGETMPWLLQSQELGAAEVEEEAEVEYDDGKEEVMFCSGCSGIPTMWR